MEQAAQGETAGEGKELFLSRQERSIKQTTASFRLNPVLLLTQELLNLNSIRRQFRPSSVRFLPLVPPALGTPAGLGRDSAALFAGK